MLNVGLGRIGAKGFNDSMGMFYLVHHICNDKVEKLFPFISVIESINIFVRIGVQMVFGPAMMYTDKPIFKQHDLPVQ